MISDSS